jgi:queuine tRNA-ribosyltransferase
MTFRLLGQAACLRVKRRRAWVDLLVCSFMLRAMSRLNFQLEATASNSQARAGRFRTLHNEVETPVFMPVGTQATVRGMRREDLERINAPILLANTYHLLLRPGPEVFQHFGGIHQFTGWKRSFLTDSGGFQVFSLAESTSKTEQGITFKSHLDSQAILLTPERSIQMQRAINSDIMMVLDECIAGTSTHEVAAKAMELTHRWALRSLAAREDSKQAMFGIVQGACFEDLREQSASFLREQAFDGFAIGGLAVGESKEEREHFTALTTRRLPPNLPRYLMGVGTPLDILEAVHRGVDMFDCIIPTAHAQHGTAFTHRGLIRIMRGAYRFDDSPLDASCACSTCQQYPKAYIHHLMKAKESLGWWLLSYHNLHFYQDLTREIREQIISGRFAEYYQTKRVELGLYDNEEPQTPSPPRPDRKPPKTLGDYELRQSTKENNTGHTVIRQISSGESMHPTGDPNTEAEAVYIKPSGLQQRVSEATQTPLIIWDVGLGAAHNAMAAIRAIESAATASSRPVEIISFENDLDSLRLALLHVMTFTHLRHAAPHQLEENREWRAKKIPLYWRLLLGDFLAQYKEAPAPDLIFYDPFSIKSDGILWSIDCFQQIAAHCVEKATMLFTYSTSTAASLWLPVKEPGHESNQPSR